MGSKKDYKGPVDAFDRYDAAIALVKQDADRLADVLRKAHAHVDGLPPK